MSQNIEKILVAQPAPPIIEKSQETCRDLVFDKAHSMYGNPLPHLIEERISQELYGDKIISLVKNTQDKNKK